MRNRSHRFGGNSNTGNSLDIGGTKVTNANDLKSVAFVESHGSPGDHRGTGAGTGADEDGRAQESDRERAPRDDAEPDPHESAAAPTDLGRTGRTNHTFYGQHDGLLGGFATVTAINGSNILTSGSMVDMKTNDPTTIQPKQ